MPNGNVLHVISGGEQEVCRLEIILDAGFWYEPKPLLSSCTAGLLMSGTSKYNSEQLATAFDAIGAFINIESGYDTCIITLYCLNKQLAKALAIIKEIFDNAIFPENEWNIYKSNILQRLSIDESKNDFLANRRFAETMYGAAHPYGRGSQAAYYEAITIEEIRNYFKTNYKLGNAKYILSGRISNHESDLVLDFVGNYKADNAILNISHAAAPQIGSHTAERKDALQSAIRIGMPWVGRSHEDFASLQVLNTVLGGFFGSRLMQNIREDKGYTYGISGGVKHKKHASHYNIGTEVGVAHTLNTLKEIKIEMNALKEHIIPVEELSRVKNYMMGSFNLSLDTIFAHADRYRSLLESELDYRYYDTYFNDVLNADAGRLNRLAQKYYNLEALNLVVAGNNG